MYSRGFPFRFLSNVFCTSNHWERIGGIPTLAQAFCDWNSRCPTFHGPPQLKHFLRQFAEHTKERFNSKPYYNDSNMRIDSVQLNSTDASMAKSTTVIAYVCRLRSHKQTIIRPNFTETNIPVEYNNGEDITLPDGGTFLAKELLTSGCDGGNFLSKF